MKKNKILALIPLRGGSKSIPFKNIKLLGGKPLCAWVIEEAINAKIFNRIIISTDSEKIAQTVKKISKKVEIIMRPKKLATDKASTESVILHIANKINFDILFTIQATSPLTKSEDFIKAYEQFQKENLDSLLTGVQVKRFFWTLNNCPLNYDPLNRPRRQDFSGVIMENGAFYITKREILKKYKCRLGGKIGIYKMEKETGIELDDLSDWKKIENILRNRIDKYSA